MKRILIQVDYCYIKAVFYYFFTYVLFLALSRLTLKLEEKIDTLQSLHPHAADTERQLAGKIAEAQLLAEQLRDANDQMAPVQAQVRELELSLAQANAKLQAQEHIGEQLRAYLDKIAAAPNAAGAGK